MSVVLKNKIYRFREDTSKYPSRQSKDDGVKKKKKKETLARILNLKLTHFSRTLTKAERQLNKTEGCNRMFKVKDLEKKLKDNPYCYLTGSKININESQTYSLDHIVPKSRGGDNSLENCGLTTRMANQMKSNQTVEELIENCKKILETKGYKITKGVDK